MKLTKAQLKGLRNVAMWNSRYSAPFHKERAASTIMAVRSNVLQRLETLGLISSARPFAGFYHTVTITDAGRRAATDGEAKP